MIDIRVVQAQAALRISSIAPIREFSPPSVLVVGEALQNTDSVFYNGVEAKEFFIAADTRLIVKIPPSQVGRPLASLTAFSASPLSGSDAVVSFGIPRLGRSVSGMSKLVQDFLLIFMTTPGSDVFDQNAGGGAMAIIGQPATGGDGSATAKLALAVDRSRQQLLRLQAKYPRIPTDERLMAASLANVSFSPTTTTVSATVYLQNMAGDASSINLG